METVIFWFRQDLRLSDNPALNAALQKKRHVIPLFIHSAHSAHSDNSAHSDKSGDDKIKWQPGAASRWAKRMEWDEYRKRVHEYEINTYLPIL